MFININNLNNEDLEKKELEFRQLVVDTPKEEALRLELSDFFGQKLDGEKAFRYSYWRWYVRVNWDLFHSLNEEDLINIAIGKQIPMAILLDFQIMKDILRYISARTYTEMSLQSLYLKIKKSFLESNAIVSIWHGKEITVAELAKEIISISGKGDSLEQAEFEGKLRQIMFPNDPVAQKYTIVDPDVGVQRFIELALFFQSVTEDNVWYAVDSFVNPEKYQNVVPGEVPPLAASAAAPITTPPKPASLPAAQPFGSAAPANAAGRPATPPQPIIKPTALVKPIPKQTPVVEPQARLTTPVVEQSSLRDTAGQVKSQIEPQFKKDAEGNFVDIEGVYKKLGELAEKYNDAKINDLIYYDESSGKFLWKLS